MAWVNGKSGTYNISTENSVISGYVKWEEQYDVDTNKSLIIQTAYLHRTNIYAGETFFASAVVTRTAFFDSETVSSTVTTGMSLPGNTSSSGGAYVQVYYAKKEVAHNADGTKNVTLGFSMSNSETGVAARSFTVPKTTATVSLTTIPRATKPTLSATSVTMGSTINVTLTPADSSFKHKIRYEFGGLLSQIDGVKLNGTQITADYLPGGTYTFTPPTSLANKIPSKNSDTAKFIVYTYRSDGTHVGTTSVNVTLNVPSYTPSVSSISIAPFNHLNGAIVQGKTSLSIDVSAESSYGASIKRVTVAVDGKTYEGSGINTSVLQSTGSKTADVTVVDTRDKTVTVKSEAFTVYAYFVPVISKFTLVRKEDDASTVIATVKGSIAAVNNKNAKIITVTLPGSNEGTITISSGYTVDGTATFTNVPTDYAITGTAIFKDSYISIPADFTVPTVAVTMDFHSSGKGVAFGKVAETENLLDVAWRIKNASVPTLLGGLGLSIGANSDLNNSTFLVPGNYVCSLNDTAKTLKNTPTSVAFKMSVSNCLDSLMDVQEGGWVYLVREITDYNGQKWTQFARKEGGNWAYSAWRTNLDSLNCPDYVIEKTTQDGWEITKWNNGKIELFAEKSLSFPATTQQTTYLWRSIVSLDLSKYLTKIMSGTCSIQVNGMIPQVCRHSSTHTLAEIVIVTSRDSGAFTITAPVYIIGKWK